jgi:hypothetical protein
MLPGKAFAAQEERHSTAMGQVMEIRKARLQDASNIYELVNSLSQDGTLLRRAFAEICENVRDFTVAESAQGIFQGCGALHLYGPHLAEVRSIVVLPEAKARAACCCRHCWMKPRTTAWDVFVFLPASPISFSSMAFAWWKIERRCPTRSTRIARIAHGSIAAMKWRWCAARFPRFRFWDPGSRPSSWCG